MGAAMGKHGGGYSSTNLLDSLQSTQSALHIVMLGLDSAGKTTALYRLKFEQYLNTVPTIGFNCERIRGTIGKSKGQQFLIWDVGGQEKLRPLWRSYTRCTDGIVFVIDSVDLERMEEAKMELMRTVKCPDNQGVPVLILANKQDLPGAKESKELEKLLGLHEMLSQDQRTTQTAAAQNSNSLNSISSSSSAQTVFAQQQQQPNSKDNDFEQTKEIISYLNQYKGWHIQHACAITGEGLHEGLDALYEMILKKRKLNKQHKKNKLQR